MLMPGEESNGDSYSTLAFSYHLCQGLFSLLLLNSMVPWFIISYEFNLKFK